MSKFSGCVDDHGELHTLILNNIFDELTTPNIDLVRMCEITMIAPVLSDT